MGPSVDPPTALYAGKYRLVREIGRGGMGSVYEAVEISLERTVAIKRMPAAQSDSFEARQRFRREVLAAARLTHPGIAQVLGFGTSDEGEHYIAMELVSGHTLRVELSRTTSASDLFVLFDQVLAVLAYAHARGVVHLDLKPENILVTRIGAAPLCKLLDFGVARSWGESEGVAPMERPAVDEEIVGTPRYMAPEQVRGEPAGPSADLYAVGVMLFEALTGIVPIGGSGDEVMERKLRYAAPSVERTRFGPASSELTRLLEQLLERDAALRMANAADARAALLACPEAGDVAPHSVRPISVRPSSEPETVRVSRSGMKLAKAVPFVARHAERAALADALAEVASRSAARLVLLEGPRGIGKTHLLEWFVRQVREEGGRTVLSGSYLGGGGPEGDGLRAAIERYLGAGGSGREGVARAVARFLGHFDEADEDEATALTNVLRPRVIATETEAFAPVATGARPTQALAVIERVLRRIAHKRPLALALDDVQLGESAALDALSFLLAVWRQAPVQVLLVAAIVTPLEDRALRNAYRRILAHEGDQVVRIPLPPLGDDDIARLAAAILDDAGTPRVASVAARAAGNPLYAVQLARLARDAQATAFAAATLPAGIQQLLEARLETVIAQASSPDLAERVLVTIALFLPPTPTALVERVLAEDGVARDAALRALDELVVTGIVREIVREGIEHVDLEHPLLGEALRARVSPRIVRRVSGQALDMKEQYFRDSERVVHELAEHARLAGRDERASELCLAAARQAYAAGKPAEAQRRLRHFAERASTGEKVPAEVALLAARIADETGDLRFAETALAFARDRGDAAAVDATLALARLLTRSGRLEDAVVALERAGAILDTSKSESVSEPRAARQELLRLRASIARRQARYDEAAAILKEAIALDPAAPAAISRLLHDNLAWTYHRGGDREAALGAAQCALALAPPGLDEGWSLRSVAVLGAAGLPVEERREHLNRALTIAREAGALRLLASALTHLGNLDRAAGDAAAAIARYHDVVQLGADYVDDDDLSECTANLVMLLLDEGRGAEASETLARRAQRRTSWEGGLRLIAAAIMAETKDIDVAVADALAVRTLGQELPACWGVARAAERLGLAFGESGNEALAAWADAQAASAWTRMGEHELSGRSESLRPQDDTVETTKRD